MTQHTPGPWKIKNHQENVGFFIDSSKHEGPYIALARYSDNPNLQKDIAEANAEFIVRACNAHDELLEALKGTSKALARALDKLDPDSVDYEWVGHATEAIAKAKNK